MSKGIVQLLGEIDGVNRSFRVITTYAEGQIHLYLNGNLVAMADDNGFEELGNRYILMKEAPRVGDTLAAFIKFA